MISYTLQPVLLAAVVGLWLYNPEWPALYPLCVIGVQLILGVLEYRYPARPEWLQPWREKTMLVALAAFIYVVAMAIGILYSATFAQPLTALRASLGMNLWPSSWHLLPQVLLAFFLSELIWYWFHRAEHRWTWVWKLSGHGAHHAFKNLGAINSGANHPVEMFVILVPSMLVELLFGAGLAAAGAGMITAVQAAIAHTNLPLNSSVIGWALTTNRYHIHHHSMVMAESNTNYGCSAILWDRVFGTFRDADTAETGTGPVEPTLWQKFMMPVRDPAGTQIAPTSPR